MLQVSIHAPLEHAASVARTIDANAYAFNVVRVPGACTKPVGDLIACMVPREALTGLLDELQDAGFDKRTGSITIDEQLTVLSDAADEMGARAAGAPGDALLWPVVRATTAQAGEFSFNYYAFMVLATFLAAIGLLTSSSVLIVGAMILGPEFGALAYICVSTLSRDPRGVGAGFLQLVSGFGAAIIATTALVAALDQVGLASAGDVAGDFERAIVSATWIGLVVACIAGIAGVLTLTSANNGALIGVLVSVTTIPAAAHVSLGLAFTDATRVGDGLATLSLNLGGMMVAGAVALLAQRALSARQRDRAHRVSASA